MKLVIGGLLVLAFQALCFAALVASMGRDVLEVALRQSGERFVHVYRAGTGWVRIPFICIREGDIFRMYEPWGDPIENYKGGYIFVAVHDAELAGIVAEAFGC
jgi:hypothetical protein